MNPALTRIGVLGGGLMGREVASVFGRWFALEDFAVAGAITAVCDISPAALDWFRRVPTVQLLTADYRELLRSDIDVVYVAVPNHLHEEVCVAALRAGKDLLVEKPFGIDLAAARRIREEALQCGRFVRISSEFPFLPGAQRAVQWMKEARPGRLLEARCGLLHSSDLDPDKPINWKRQSRYCGRAGVMNDLGLHALHLPFRLGWKPLTVHGRLQKIYAKRPDGKGGMAECDTWDNAVLHLSASIAGQSVPLTVELKRMAPTETNTWFFEVLGTDGGVRYSTKEPKTLWQYHRHREQSWQKTDLGFAMPFKTITGSIFEPGFPDLLMQMWAAFLAERAGVLKNRFGCATPDEAVRSHEIWEAALASHETQTILHLDANPAQPPAAPLPR